MTRRFAPGFLALSSPLLLMSYGVDHRLGHALLALLAGAFPGGLVALAASSTVLFLVTGWTGRREARIDEAVLAVLEMDSEPPETAPGRDTGSKRGTA